MAKKQSRRSISVSRGLFEVAKLHAKKVDRPLSQITEDALRVAIASGIDPELGAAFDKMMKEMRAKAAIGATR